MPVYSRVFGIEKRDLVDQNLLGRVRKSGFSVGSEGRKEGSNKEERMTDGMTGKGKAKGKPGR